MFDPGQKMLAYQPNHYYGHAHAGERWPRAKVFRWRPIIILSWATIRSTVSTRVTGAISPATTSSGNPSLSIGPSPNGSGGAINKAPSTMSGANSETVLITGASSGIGRELAKCFAADGSRLVLTARNTEALQSLADELRRQHKVEAIGFDRRSFPARNSGTHLQRIAGQGNHGGCSGEQRRLRRLGKVCRVAAANGSWKCFRSTSPR